MQLDRDASLVQRRQVMMPWRSCRWRGQGGKVPVGPKYPVSIGDPVMRDQQIDVLGRAGVQIGVAPSQRTSRQALDEHNWNQRVVEKCDRHGGLGFNFHAKCRRLERLFAQLTGDVRREGAESIERTKPPKEPDRAPFVGNQRREALGTDCSPT